MNRHEPTPFLEDRLYFRQWLSGRDFAVGDPTAEQMVNFTYAIGDSESGEVVLVDPCYAVNEIVDLVERDGMKVTGALATHCPLSPAAFSRVSWVLASSFFACSTLPSASAKRRRHSERVAPARVAESGL